MNNIAIGTKVSFGKNFDQCGEVIGEDAHGLIVRRIFGQVVHGVKSVQTLGRKPFVEFKGV